MTEQSPNQTGTLSTPIVQYSSVQYQPPIDPAAIEKALTVGDVGKMDALTRVRFYQALCASCGLNVLTRPFILLKTQSGELTWYATVGAAEQLRRLHRVSTRILIRECIDEGLYSVVAEVWTPDGRREEAQAVVVMGNVKGLERANAIMRCESKAKRRATLAICGLGLALEGDERGVVVPFNPQTGAVDLPPEPQEEAGTLLTTVGQWFRQRPQGSREAIAQAVWGCTLHEMPHLGSVDLSTGWHVIDAGRAPLAWDSPSLAEDLAQWQQAHAQQAILDVFDRSEGHPED